MSNLLTRDPMTGCAECRAGECISLSTARTADVVQLLTGQTTDHGDSVWEVAPADPGQLLVTCSGTTAMWRISTTVLAMDDVRLDADGRAVRR